MKNSKPWWVHCDKTIVFLSEIWITSIVIGLYQLWLFFFLSEHLNYLHLSMNIMYSKISVNEIKLWIYLNKIAVELVYLNQSNVPETNLLCDKNYFAKISKNIPTVLEIILKLCFLRMKAIMNIFVMKST